MAIEKGERVVTVADGVRTTGVYTVAIPHVDHFVGPAVRVRSAIGGSILLGKEVLNHTWTVAGSQGQYGGAVVVVEADTVEEAGRVARDLLERGAPGERVHIVAVFPGEQTYWVVE